MGKPEQAKHSKCKKQSINSQGVRRINTDANLEEGIRESSQDWREAQRVSQKQVGDKDQASSTKYDEDTGDQQPACFLEEIGSRDKWQASWKLYGKTTLPCP